MSIGIGNIQSIGNAIQKPKITENQDVNEFGNVFKGLIDNVAKSQAESSELTQKLIQGGDVELHEVMIAGEKAKTNLQLLMEIRNKSLDMYKELTRIQI
jgi:flagellar hook-basal body complex protein FliE